MKLEIALLLLIGYSPKQISDKLQIKLGNIYHYQKQLEFAKERLKGLK